MFSVNGAATDDRVRRSRPSSVRRWPQRSEIKTNRPDRGVPRESLTGRPTISSSCVQYNNIIIEYHTNTHVTSRRYSDGGLCARTTRFRFCSFVSGTPDVGCRRTSVVSARFRQLNERSTPCVVAVSKILVTHDRDTRFSTRSAVANSFSPSLVFLSLQTFMSTRKYVVVENIL